MEKKYVVRLSDAEREQLTAIVRKFSGSSQKGRPGRMPALPKRLHVAPAGWREAYFCETKTKADWALLVADLLEGRYAGCDKVTLVCDNLNTHPRGAFYEVFEPARALVRRIDWCHTPKHGSWLNIAENE